MRAYGRTDRIVGTRKATDPKRRKKHARQLAREETEAELSEWWDEREWERWLRSVEGW